VWPDWVKTLLLKTKKIEFYELLLTRPQPQEEKNDNSVVSNNNDDGDVYEDENPRISNVDNLSPWLIAAVHNAVNTGFPHDIWDVASFDWKSRALQQVCDYLYTKSNKSDKIHKHVAETVFKLVQEDAKVIDEETEKDAGLIWQLVLHCARLSNEDFLTHPLTGLVVLPIMKRLLKTHWKTTNASGDSLFHILANRKFNYTLSLTWNIVVNENSAKDVVLLKNKAGLTFLHVLSSLDVFQGLAIGTTSSILLLPEFSLVQLLDISKNIDVWKVFYNVNYRTSWSWDSPLMSILTNIAPIPDSVVQYLGETSHLDEFHHISSG
jgi:hypothetical protein